MTDSELQKKLIEVHGDGLCYICHKPRAEKGEDYCSYPHGRIPVAPVNASHPDGFWTWKKPL